MHQYTAQQLLPMSLEEAWDFFSSPKNLSKITPPEMKFKILNQNLPQDVHEGMLIDYSVRPLWNIPMRWQTKIEKVEKLKSFTDSQLKGPYKVWQHTHTFTAVANGVLMNDVVLYKLPFGFIGRLVHSLIVKNKVAEIFEFRTQTLKQLFAKNKNNNS
jgi:ligand-binding SRPBCC domain-containing protein